MLAWSLWMLGIATAASRTRTLFSCGPSENSNVPPTQSQRLRRLPVPTVALPRDLAAWRSCVLLLAPRPLRPWTVLRRKRVGTVAEYDEPAPGRDKIRFRQAPAGAENREINKQHTPNSNSTALQSPDHPRRRAAPPGAEIRDMIHNLNITAVVENTAGTFEAAGEWG